ncbi:MAG: WG repeat-containing protein [Bacteroidia bacterium]
MKPSRSIPVTVGNENQGKVQWKIVENFSTLNMNVKFLLEYLLQNNAHYYGVTDAEDRILIPCKYESIRYLYEDLFIARLNGKWGIIGVGNREVLPCKYESLNYLYEDLFAARLNGKYGIIDEHDKLIMPHNYDEIESHNREMGFFLVKKDGLQGVIDKQEKVIVPFCYHEIESVSNIRRDDYYNIMYQEKMGMLDRQYHEIIPCQYDRLMGHGINNTLIEATNEGKIGIINAKNEVIIPLIYDEVSVYSDKLFAVKLGEKCKLVNQQHQPLTHFAYQSTAWPISLSLSKVCIPVQSNNKWGVINETGKQLIPFIYEEIISTSMENLIVKQNEKYGILDKEGKCFIPNEYEDILLFDSCIALKQNEKWKYINRNKVEINPNEYDAISNENDAPSPLHEAHCSIVKRNGKYGFVNTSGIETTPCVHDTLYKEYTGFYDEIHYLVAGKNAKYGVLNLEGEVICPVQYDSLFLMPKGVTGYIHNKGKYYPSKK